MAAPIHPLYDNLLVMPELDDDISHYLVDKVTDRMIDDIRNHRRSQVAKSASNPGDQSIKKTINSNGFLGSGWSFPPTFDIDKGAVVMAQGDEDIHQSLKILFSTMLRERVMLPDYGSKLPGYVFGSIGPALFTQIQDALNWSILYYEPRISQVKIDVAADNFADGIVTISLSYVVVQTNARSNMVFPFYLNSEGTHVRRIT
jgi:uncharacterized protein